MSIAEKLTVVADNQQRVYDAGYAKGKAEGGGCGKTNVIVTREPTCTEEGEATFTCAGCGAVGTEAIPMIAHTYEDGFCTACGAPYPYGANSYPVKDGLKGLYDLGGTEEASLVNHAPEPYINTADEVLNGTVAVTEDYCTFAGNVKDNRMLTYLRMPMGNALTTVVLFRVPSGKRVLVGNRGNDSNYANYTGVSLFNNSVLASYNGYPTEKAFKDNISINSSNNFSILAMTVDANGYVRVVRYLNGALVDMLDIDGENRFGPIKSWITGDTGLALQIGGCSFSAKHDSADISMVAIHEGVLGDDQLADACRFVYDYGTNAKGLTIE